MGSSNCGIFELPSHNPLYSVTSESNRVCWEQRGGLEVGQGMLGTEGRVRSGPLRGRKQQVGRRQGGGSPRRGACQILETGLIVLGVEFGC